MMKNLLSGFIGKKNFWPRLFIALLAVLSMGVTLSFLIQVNLGTDPCTLMNRAVAAKLHMSLGNWQALMNIILLVIVLIFGATNFGFGSLFNMFLIGYTIDFCTWLWNRILPMEMFQLWSVRIGVLIPAIIFSACLVLFISWVYEKGSQKQEKDNGINKKYRIAWLLFIAYIIVTFQTVFFSREAGSRKEISLVLFETWGHSFHMHAMFIENIIMFIPFGVLLPIVFKQVRSGWKCVLIGFLCSCGIEITQHITQRGYLQLDDVVTNTVGMFIGWAIWKIVCKCLRTCLSEKC